MPLKSNPKIALIGNPNSGKSSLFNQLTGLHQKVGNFPGVTVDKRTGQCKLDEYITANIIDLPGTYSLYARCADEKAALEVLNNPKSPFFPDLLIFIADASNLKRNLLLFSQVKDLGIPVVLALNMLDVARQAGISVQAERLQELLGVPVVTINARSGEGLEKLRYLMTNPLRREEGDVFFDVYPLAPKAIDEVKQRFDISSNYSAWQLLQQGGESEGFSAEDQQWLLKARKKHHFRSNELQARETIERYQHIHHILARASRQLRDNKASQLLQRFDTVLTHPLWGHLSFIGLLFLLFQLVFWIGNAPLALLDGFWSSATASLEALLPEGWLSQLLISGVLPAIGGVFLFVPHLLVFFTLMALLEESGYMSRMMLLMDKLMRRFGLNGRSAIPLLSTAACHVPALMAKQACAWRQRVKHIFVAPLVNCSPRLPVYILLIGLFVPPVQVLGFLSVQGLLLLAMYGFSFFAAILSSWALKLLVKVKDEESFVMELPHFTRPYWRDISHIVWVNLSELGLRTLRVVVPMAALIWFLLHLTTQNSEAPLQAPLHESQQQASLVSATLELKAALSPSESLAAQLGELIAPTVRPLGFDWQLGLAVISSFAAREAFVGSLATLSSQDVAQERSLLARIRHKHSAAGRSLVPPVLISLLVFYAFAMQYFHMAGTVLRQSTYWWAPLLQLIYMTLLAYASAFAAHQLFS